MPFESIDLEKELIGKLDAFLMMHGFVKLYSTYNWKKDRFNNDFPCIFSLEKQFLQSKDTGVTLSDMECVAKWGGNHKKIKSSSDIVLSKCFLVGNDGTINSNIKDRPLEPLLNFADIKYIGPTYYSKALRFALPQEYGAIDTRLVRVFGEGDFAKYKWLTLSTKKSKKNRWCIPENQYGWPAEYGKWINILRYFASKLTNNCPHPQCFVDAGLRKNGVWECADVEMALFSYASQQLRNVHEAS